MIIRLLKIVGCLCFVFGVLLFVLGGIAAFQSRPAVVAMPWGFVLMVIGGPIYALARIVQLLERLIENTRQPYIPRPQSPPDDEPRVETKYQER